MKKPLLVMTSIVMVALLTACGQQKSQSEQTSQPKQVSVSDKKKAQSSKKADTTKKTHTKEVNQPKKESVSDKKKAQSSKKVNTIKKTPAKEVNQPKQMNLDQIQVSDYSSIVGQWQIVKLEARGRDLPLDDVQPLNITKDSLVSSSSFTLNKAGLKDQNGLHATKFEVANNILTASLSNASDVSINWSVMFYPKGTSHEYGVNTGEETNKQNLIVVWSSSNSVTAVYSQS